MSSKADVVPLSVVQLRPDVSDHSDELHLALFFDRDMAFRTWWVCKPRTFGHFYAFRAWLTQSKLIPFDFGPADLEMFRNTNRKSGKKISTTMQRQVLFGYEFACRSRDTDPSSVTSLYSETQQSVQNKLTLESPFKITSSWPSLIQSCSIRAMSTSFAQSTTLKHLSQSGASMFRDSPIKAQNENRNNFSRTYK